MYVSKNQKLNLASNLNCTPKLNGENLAEFYVCMLTKKHQKQCLLARSFLACFKNGLKIKPEIHVWSFVVEKIYRYSHNWEFV